MRKICFEPCRANLEKIPQKLDWFDIVDNDKHKGVWANCGFIFRIFNTISTICTIYING